MSYCKKSILLLFLYILLIFVYQGIPDTTKRLVIVSFIRRCFKSGLY